MRKILVSASLLLAVASPCSTLRTNARADDPNERYAVMDRVVKDLATGLTWQRTAPADRVDWPSAVAYCKGLKVAGGGWRLPTLKELYTLVDETRVKPAIDPEAFPETDVDYYWSSSQLADYPMNAWTLELSYGNDVWLDVTQKQRARCVR